jgi:hypothetical protein
MPQLRSMRELMITDSSLGVPHPENFHEIFHENFHGL